MKSFFRHLTLVYGLHPRIFPTLFEIKLVQINGSFQHLKMSGKWDVEAPVSPDGDRGEEVNSLLSENEDIEEVSVLIDKVL